MGEQSIPPHENGQNEKEESPPNDNTEMEVEEDDEFDDMSPEEFEQLDNQLDALNSALDDIEQKNDDIHAQLLQLLTANREIRQQLQEANKNKQT